MLSKLTTMSGNVNDTIYKVETLEYNSGKVISALLVAGDDDTTIGTNMLQVSCDGKTVRMKSKTVEKPPVIDLEGDIAGQLRRFAAKHAEALILSGNTAESTSEGSHGKHTKIA